MELISALFNTLFTNPILNILLLIYHFTNDFGLAIVVLTLIINLVLLPLTIRQLKAAKARQTLTPELTEIRRLHSGDLRAQQAAEAVLYKQHNVSVPSPWLSLITQTPLFIGLYFALNTVLTQSKLAQLNALLYSFLPQLSSLPMLDLTWLSILHSSWHFSLGLPDPTNILPLLTGFLTFVQMRLAQPADRETLTQATQLMQFVLPCVMALVTIFITAKFASGIALYRAISLLWNSVQQLCINGWGALFSFPRFAVQSVNAASVSTNNVQVQAKQVRRKGHTGRRHTGRRRGR